MKLIYSLFIILLLIGMTSLVYADLTTDNVVYYSFDDDSVNGSNPVDLSGNNYLGSNNGAVTSSSGILGESFFYDGTSGYVNIGDSLSSVIKNGKLTFSMWVKQDNIAVTHHTVFSFGYDSSNRCYLRYRASEGNYGNMYCVIDGTSVTMPNFAEPTDTAWHHIALVIDNTNYAFYYDGNLSTTYSWSKSPSDLSGIVRLVIGSLYHTSNYYAPFDGYIDEFAFYNRTLNDSDISSLYNSGFALNPYKFISLNETTARDKIVSLLNDNSLTYSVSQDTQAVLRLSNGQQYQSYFDMIVNVGNVRYLINYDESENATFQNIQNITPVVYVWQKNYLTETEITNSITQLLNETLN